MKALLTRLGDWFDHRTGARRLMHEALYENIPGGAKWRYVWGSTLVVVFFVQLVTGVFLWMAYSPSANTAWESVYYIQHEMTGGALLRGIHHYAAQAMVVLLALHLLQVVIDGAYRAPREINFWLGLVLMLIVLGLSLTGYLLPWDQKGYWATKVATNLLGLVPLAGPELQKLVVGGDEYGHHTLTRFFALHAGILPGLLVLFLVLHLALFRRHGIKAHRPERRPDQKFWPEQVLRDSVASLAVLAVVLFFAMQFKADLGAPADPSRSYGAARPEWYFLFLFQFLKLFEGQGETGELLAAIVLPGLAMLLLFLMPILGRWKLGHHFNVAYLVGLLAGVGVLTGLALWDDHNDDEYRAAVEEAGRDAEVVRQLAQSRYRIPIEGAGWMLRNDPRRLFQAHCASCHSHAGPQGEGIRAAESSAPNLHGFASRAWIRGLLDPQRIGGPEYFGNTKHADGTMIEYVRDELNEDGGWTPEEIENVVLALSAEAELPSQRKADVDDRARILEGRKLLADEERCAQCHKFHGEGGGSGPDLTDYGSTDWLVHFMADPTQTRFYGRRNDRMPSFCKSLTDPVLTPKQLRLIADWLRGDFWEIEE